MPNEQYLRTISGPANQYENGIREMLDKNLHSLFSNTNLSKEILQAIKPSVTTLRDEILAYVRVESANNYYQKEFWAHIIPEIFDESRALVYTLQQLCLSYEEATANKISPLNERYAPVHNFLKELISTLLAITIYVIASRKKLISKINIRKDIAIDISDKSVNIIKLIDHTFISQNYKEIIFDLNNNLSEVIALYKELIEEEIITAKKLSVDVLTNYNNAAITCMESLSNDLKVVKAVLDNVLNESNFTLLPFTVITSFKAAHRAHGSLKTILKAWEIDKARPKTTALSLAQPYASVFPDINNMFSKQK